MGLLLPLCFKCIFNLRKGSVKPKNTRILSAFSLDGLSWVHLIPVGSGRNPAISTSTCVQLFTLIIPLQLGRPIPTVFNGNVGSGTRFPPCPCVCSWVIALMVLAARVCVLSVLHSTFFFTLQTYNTQQLGCEEFQVLETSPKEQSCPWHVGVLFGFLVQFQMPHGWLFFLCPIPLIAAYGSYVVLWLSEDALPSWRARVIFVLLDAWCP